MKIKDVVWENYIKTLKNNKYYCHKCALKLFVHAQSLITKLKASKSFYDWCIENDRQDLLDRWDYDLNKCNPQTVSFGTEHKYYFKCPKELHKSELTKITYITNNTNKQVKCSYCNSFAQWGLDKIGQDFLIKYWDWEKNEEEGIDPWNIAHQWNNKVWIYCQEKSYHGSYPIQCCDFVKGNRCPFCSCKLGKVHRFDSLGWKKPEVFKYWSDKNKKSPYYYSVSSDKNIFWKCPANKHKDYCRKISVSVKYNFHCPECNYSKGETQIENYFKSIGWIGCLHQTYNHLNLNTKPKIQYIGQYHFKNLSGLGNGLLSYDFYLPQYNLLIEYQGEQHDHPIDFNGEGIEKAEENFKVQVEHDRRKKQYAKNHDIELLEIWYWDYDNIEKILKEKIERW